jgi:hypothetical protein
MTGDDAATTLAQEQHPLHLAACLREGPCSDALDAVGIETLCLQAGTRERGTARSSSLCAHTHAAARPRAEHDSALRAALLRYVQRKLFAADERSQLAGASPASRAFSSAA